MSVNSAISSSLQTSKERLLRGCQMFLKLVQRQTDSINANTFVTIGYDEPKHFHKDLTTIHPQDTNIMEDFCKGTT